MTTMERVRKRIAEKPETRSIKVLDVPVLVVCESKKNLDATKFTAASSDEAVAGFLASKLLDPDTMAPAFTKEFLLEELSFASTMDLWTKYVTVTRGGTVEDAEKN